MPHHDALSDVVPSSYRVTISSYNATTMRVKEVNEIVARQSHESKSFASGYQESRQQTSHKKLFPVDDDGIKGFCILTSASAEGGFDGCMLAVSNFIPLMHTPAASDSKAIEFCVMPDHLQIVVESPRMLIVCF